MKELPIKPQYKHSKLGQICFNISAKATIFFVRHRVLYYLVSIVWNFPMFLVGTLITTILGITAIFTKKIKFKKYHWVYYISIGPDYWGGFDTALMFIRDHRSVDKYLNTHEWGHSIAQGTWLGPLFPFVVAIPSISRWWARELNKKKQWPAYDAVWFEDAATQCGNWAAKQLEIIKK